MRARPAQRRKEARCGAGNGRTNAIMAMGQSLRAYSHQNLAWLCVMERVLGKARSLRAQVQALEVGEWLQRYFEAGAGRRELPELLEYYKYYRCSPLVAAAGHFEFMNGYWGRSKTLYYLRIKRILQIDQDHPQDTLDKNISSQDHSHSPDDRSTFYLMPQIAACPPFNDNTLEKILSSLQRGSREEREGRTIKDIDKAYKFPREGSKTKDRHSQQKSHLRTNPSNLISQFSYKPSNKKKKQNHKSLSNEPHEPHPDRPLSRAKKLATTSSCMNIAHDTNLNYLRRDKKNSQKDLKAKKREPSQACLNEPRPHPRNDSRPKLHEHKGSRGHDGKGSHAHDGKGSHAHDGKGSHAHDGKGSHKKGGSHEKSTEGKSGKKRLETQSNVKAAIDKTRNKIKMEKSIMLKKYVESRQSHTKSIDSTCGEAVKHPRR